MVKGFRKVAPAPQTRLPITISVLKHLTSSLSSILQSHYQVVMYKAMFLLAFHACLRIGEITSKPGQQHNLHMSDVTFLHLPSSPLDSILITFRSFKHSKPHDIKQLEVVEVPETRPVQSLKVYLSLRGPSPGPLFMWQDTLPVTYSQFTKVLTSALNFAGYSTSHNKSHSFRIGQATLALQQGLTQLQIMKLGRWSSAAHLKYLLPTSLSSWLSSWRWFFLLSVWWLWRKSCTNIDPWYSVLSKSL